MSLKISPDSDKKHRNKRHDNISFFDKRWLSYNKIIVTVNQSKKPLRDKYYVVKGRRRKAALSDNPQLHNKTTIKQISNKSQQTTAQLSRFIKTRRIKSACDSERVQ